LTPQVTTLEKDLMNSVAELHKQRWIVGKLLSLEDQVEERRLGTHHTNLTQRLLLRSVTRCLWSMDEIIEVNSEDEDGGEVEVEVEVEVSIAEMIQQAPRSPPSPPMSVWLVVDLRSPKWEVQFSN